MKSQNFLTGLEKDVAVLIYEDISIMNGHFFL